MKRQEWFESIDQKTVSSWLKIQFAILLAMGIGGSVSADEPNRFLSQFEAATRHIECFDINATVTQKYNYRLKDGELVKMSPPKITTWKQRHVQAKDGRQRFDVREGIGIDEVSKVYDGKIVKSLAIKQKHGGVRSRPPWQEPLAIHGANYLSTYRDVFHGGKLVDLLRERPFIAKKVSDDVIQFKASGKDGTSMYPRFAFLISLSASRGFLPTRISTLDGDLRSIQFEMVNKKFIEIEGNLHVPLETVTTSFARIDDGPRLPVSEVSMKVDKDKSSWNEPVDDDALHLSWPVGTTVLDETRDIVFVTGTPDVGQSMDAIIQGARKN